MSHLEHHNLLCHLQHGFRRLSHATEPQLNEFVSDIVDNSHVKQTDIITLDISKAFDKVSHNRLLYKLENYGIRGDTLEWIKAFLENRQQCVVVDGEKSDFVAVLSGVPQGSVIGSVLFLAYINDLPQNIRSRVRLFADDNVLYLIITSEEHCRQLQDDLDALQK